jgi:hypothetical protein
MKDQYNKHNVRRYVMDPQIEYDKLNKKKQRKKKFGYA